MTTGHAGAVAQEPPGWPPHSSQHTVPNLDVPV